MIVGVVGAGTMGAGIAQLACAAGMEARLHDPVAEALEKGVASVRRGLAKFEEKGRLGPGEADTAAARLRTAGDIADLAGCDLVIEAAPERAELKRELFARLSEVCGPETVLATNTSSIPVTSLAGAAARPENVVGMHFFNPPPLMKLLEVIPADQTDERALALARATGEAMGKHVILAADGPGFLVNRCGRPFGAEALRIVQEGIATPEQVDRICRLGGGCRMGPFELADMVGIDVGFEVAKSFTELSFGEPRWKPSPLQARMVAAGRLGRKAGRGWYEYEEGIPHRPADQPSPEPGGGEGRTVLFWGNGPVADGLQVRAATAGYDLEPGTGKPALIVEVVPVAPDLGPEWDVDDVEGGYFDVDGDPDRWQGVPRLVWCPCASLAGNSRHEPEREACGFHLLPPVEEAKLVELTAGSDTTAEDRVGAEAFFTSLGFQVEWVGDAPGLVLGRIVCQLVNEAAFAIGESVGSAEDVDAGVTLGLNHPRGPVAWSEAIGVGNVLATLDALWDERHEERYRAAPLLRRAATLRISLTEAAG